jgi:hypothetical protein
MSHQGFATYNGDMQRLVSPDQCKDPVHQILATIIRQFVQADARGHVI